MTDRYAGALKVTEETRGDQAAGPGSGGARPVSLYRQDFATRPAFDTALARALLIRASDGLAGESLWLHRPARLVAFGRQDIASVEYGKAVEAARLQGFEAVERLGGGRAAVFHHGTISFSWTIPDVAPRDAIHARVEALAEVMAGAFRRLGIDARVGEVPGEYCPGAWSVNAGGRTKLMGVGQRVALRASHVGGVVVVEDAAAINRVLDPVYAALGVDWDPAVTGAIANELPGTSWEAACAAIEAEFAARYAVEPATVAPEAIALAESFEREHISPKGGSR